MKLLFLILLLLSCLPALAQDIYCVDLDKPDFEHYEAFNQDIKGKKIILLGEYHYRPASYTLQADLFIHLNKQLGVRHLLLEFGHAEVYLYNQYLQTGDKWYLDYTFSGFSDYPAFYASMKKLYDYNSGLDNDKKLVIHGLDFEREPGLSAALYTLLADYQDARSVEFRDAMKARLDTIGIQRDIKEHIYDLREKVAALPLPDDENKKVIDDILSNESFLSRMGERDSLMSQAIIRIDTTNEIYFGQLGAGHTMLNGGMGKTLNSQKKYQNKVLVANMYYLDSNDDHPFKNLSDCPVFLYRVDPTDEKLGGFAGRHQWALILEDQPSYQRAQ